MGTSRILARLLCLLTRLIAGATVRWVDCEPSTRQRIYFANHSSHLDAVVLWSALPAEVRALTRPVAAEDYWGASRWRRYLAQEIFHAVLIPRPSLRAAGAGQGAARNAATRAIASIMAAMGDLHSVIIFPEGTRGSGETVAPFKSGLYHLARCKPGVECIPVAMENLNRILPKGESLPVPLLSSVSFGPALQWRQAESKQEFLSRARQAIMDLGSA